MASKGGISKVSGNAWKSQDFVLEVPNEQNSSYPEHAVFNLFGEDKIASINLREGMEVMVYFNLSATESKDGVWFNKLRVWKIDAVGEEAPKQAYKPKTGSATAKMDFKSQATNKEEEEDSLPF